MTAPTRQGPTGAGGEIHHTLGASGFVGTDGNARQVDIGRPVRGHDVSLCRRRSSSNDQVMSASWASLSPHHRQQCRMRSRNRRAVIDDRNDAEDVIDERLTA